jgi:hypothetical protein
MSDAGVNGSATGGELDGLSAVVTGGASGIGLAVDGGMQGLRLRPAGKG